MTISSFIHRISREWQALKRDMNRSSQTAATGAPYLPEDSEVRFPKRFKDKVALITGGGSGIGRATAIRLAQEGAAIGIAGRNLEKIKKVCQDIEIQGGQAIDIKCDVTSESDCHHMVEEIINRFGRLDVLVCSAGIHGGGETVVDTPVALWDEVLNIDLRGAYLSAKFAIQEMHKLGGGAIVNISSIGGMHGSSHGTAFQSAKGGLINLTRHMAVAHALENVRVNCICPGVIETPLTQRWLNNWRTYRQVKKWHPMNRLGAPEEVAAAVAFLASNEASFITGAILPVDGGYLASGRGEP
jgi:NAD(P)-dependent dehydrogenase (short-subunit alcohol dehydrogenase family)